MNPYQDVIDWLRSEEGSAWSEARMRRAMYQAAGLDTALSWHLNRAGSLISTYPLYMAGVLSVKEDCAPEPVSRGN